MLINGDCLEKLKEMEANSVDTIITDPPYGLSFMGKKWDYDVPSIEIWQECLRVLKPGGTALIFAGSRTQHRMACNVEDAGFVLKDCMLWIFGSGFPKATDISKQLDKLNGREIELYKEIGRHIKEKREEKGISIKEMNKIFGYVAGCTWWESQNDNNVRLINLKDWYELKDLISVDDKYTKTIERIEAEREVIGKHEAPAKSIYTQGEDELSKDVDITKSATQEAKLWNGWKSHGLKPAYEPILVAQKPNNGTYANNALTWGVSGLNIDGSRITSSKNAYKDDDNTENKDLSHILSDILHTLNNHKPFSSVELSEKDLLSNAVLYAQSWYKDKGSLCDCQTYLRLYDALLPLFREDDPNVFQKLHDVHADISRLHKESSNSPHDYTCPHSTCDVLTLLEKSYILLNELYSKYTPKDIKSQGRFPANLILSEEAGKNAGEWSRYFYCAKASKAERNAGCEGLEEKSNMRVNAPRENEEAKTSNKMGNFHPTIKPLKLMEYLCTLTATPTKGIVLDPFMGSGTTGVACKNTDRDFIGIEREKEYINIAKARILHAKNERAKRLI